LVRPG